MSSSADRLRAARLLIRTEDGAFVSRLFGFGEAAGVRARVLGVLRWQRALDAVLEPRCRQPLERLDPEVRAILRIGLFEAVHLGVPAAVATDAAVRTTRSLGRGSAAGLVNAVLRRAVPAWSVELENAPADLRWSHPEWLYRRWADRFGAEAAAAAMAVDQEPAPVWVWFTDDGAIDRLTNDDVVLSPHPWCPDCWSAPDHASRLLSAVAAGDAYAQDPSSQLVAHLVRRLVDRATCVVDLCAAPGGKAALMARLGAVGGGIAVDLRLQRVLLMAPLLERVGIWNAVVADSTRPPLADSSADLVVLDAPCSGTGTLRRHPDIRWRLRPESVQEMADLQRRLLSAGLDLVGTGGILLYATCSVEPEENEQIFEPEFHGFQVIDLEAVLPTGVPWTATTAGGIRILPHLDGDGFTIHALRRSQ